MLGRVPPLGEPDGLSDVGPVIENVDEFVAALGVPTDCPAFSVVALSLPTEASPEDSVGGGGDGTVPRGGVDDNPGVVAGSVPVGLGRGSWCAGSP